MQNTIFQPLQLDAFFKNLTEALSVTYFIAAVKYQKHLPIRNEAVEKKIFDTIKTQATNLDLVGCSNKLETFFQLYFDISVMIQESFHQDPKKIHVFTKAELEFLNKMNIQASKSSLATITELLVDANLSDNPEKDHLDNLLEKCRSVIANHNKNFISSFSMLIKAENKGDLSSVLNNLKKAVQNAVNISCEDDEKLELVVIKWGQALMELIQTNLNLERIKLVSDISRPEF